MNGVFVAYDPVGLSTSG